MENEKLTYKAKYEQLQKEVKAADLARSKKQAQDPMNQSFQNLEDNLKMVDQGMTPVKRTVQYGQNIGEMGSSRNTLIGSNSIKN